MVITKKSGGYERSGDVAGSFPAIPMEVIENAGAGSYIPKLYGQSEVTD